MKLLHYHHWIAGKDTPSANGDYFQVIQPSTGEAYATVSNGSQADLETAIASARHAFRDSGWAQDRALRVRSLRQFAERIRGHLPQLVELESQATGRPIREMRSQLARIAEWYEYFASVAETMEDQVPPFGRGYLNYTRREPLGIVGLLTPWNHPLLILTKKLAPALAAGNAVVIKPSELAPVTVNELVRLTSGTDMPPGIINVVHGYGSVVGKALAEHPGLGKIDLTGGTVTGRTVASVAGYNLTKVAAELGGKASVLVFEDADLGEAVNGAAFAGFIASGQTCVQGARVLVPHSRYDSFVAAFVNKVKSLRIGNPLDPGTDIGPLISSKQRERVLQYVRLGVEEGAHLAYGGTPLTDRPGWYMTPAVFTEVANGMTIAQEEIFGPVVCILRYHSEEEAIRLANATVYGLAMSIWTNDLRRAHRVAEQLEAGVIWINDHHRIDPSSPWGGYKESGIGRENGIDCYKDYTQVKNIVVNVNPDPFDWFDGSTEAKRYS